MCWRRGRGRTHTPSPAHVPGWGHGRPGLLTIHRPGQAPSMPLVRRGPGGGQGRGVGACPNWGEAGGGERRWPAPACARRSFSRPRPLSRASQRRGPIAAPGQHARGDARAHALGWEGRCDGPALLQRAAARKWACAPCPPFRRRPHPHSLSLPPSLTSTRRGAMRAARFGPDRGPRACTPAAETGRGPAPRSSMREEGAVVFLPW